jgi:putative tryptophan/tyrosine transport system substrate-binding protein
MQRRDFIKVIGGSAAAWPFAARAQRPSKLPTIGVLGPTTSSVAGQWTAALAQRLRELGWIEGHTVAIEYRWAQGNSERAAEIVGEFTRLKVDVIVTPDLRMAIVAKQMTQVIPIVFVANRDPVAEGLVASLARPGGNATGLSTQLSKLAAKRIELLREATPGLSRMAVLIDPSNPGVSADMIEVQAAARTLGIEIVICEIRQVENIAPAFEAITGRVQALTVMPGRLTFDNPILINTLALAARLPTIYAFRAPVESGGLMFYGANFQDLSRRAADYVDKILRGAKPGDLAVQQPIKFELVINLRTARELGLEIPPRLIVLANELIE